MSDSIFLLGDDGVLIEVSSAPYDAEAELLKLLLVTLPVAWSSDQPGQPAPLAAGQA